MKVHPERLRDAWPLRAWGLPGAKSAALVHRAGFVLTAGLAVLIVIAAATA